MVATTSKCYSSVTIAYQCQVAKPTEPRWCVHDRLMTLEENQATSNMLSHRETSKCSHCEALHRELRRAEENYETYFLKYRELKKDFENPGSFEKNYSPEWFRVKSPRNPWELSDLSPEDQLDSLLRSRSWRITAPLRASTAFLKKIRDMVLRH